MPRKVTTSKEAIGPVPTIEPTAETVEPVAGSDVPSVEAPAETPAPAPAEVPPPVVESPPAPPAPPVEPTTSTAAKPPFLTIQVNQIQKIAFGDGSEYTATFGLHEIRDERLANNLRELLNRPHKRQIFVL